VQLPVTGVDGTATLQILLNVVQNHVNVGRVVSHVVLPDGLLYARLGRRLQGGLEGEDESGADQLNQKYD